MIPARVLRHAVLAAVLAAGAASPSAAGIRAAAADEAEDPAIQMALLAPPAVEIRSDDGALGSIQAAPTPRPYSGSRWMSFGFGTGPVQWDANLADYQWDVDPRLGWGAHAFAGVGRFGLGVRLFEARTRQSLGDGMPPATVIARSSELAGRAALASFYGVGLMGTASIGRLHVAWNPSHTTLAAPGAPVEVDFAPIDAWVVGFGVGVERSLGGPWIGRLALDRRAFGWDTAHRAGDAIEVGHESFGNWSARLEVDWIRLGR